MCGGSRQTRGRVPKHLEEVAGWPSRCFRKVKGLVLGRNLDLLLEGYGKENQSPVDAPKGQSERSGCLVGPRVHLYRGFIADAQRTEVSILLAREIDLLPL